MMSFPPFHTPVELRGAKLKRSLSWIIKSLSLKRGNAAVLKKKKKKDMVQRTSKGA